MGSRGVRLAMGVSRGGRRVQLARRGGGRRAWLAMGEDRGGRGIKLVMRQGR